jgi:hypothetical protein
MNQPLVCAGFGGFKCHVCVFYDALMVNHAHRPSGNAGRDTAVIVYTIGHEFLSAAENAVPSAFVSDAEIHVEPSLTLKHIDKLLKEILWRYFCRIKKCCVALFHLSPPAWLTRRLPGLS